MEVTLSGHVYAKWEEWKHGWTFDFFQDTGEPNEYLIQDGRLPIQQATITFDMPDMENLRLIQLRRQKEAIVKEFKARLDQVNEQIRNYEALPSA